MSLEVIQRPTRQIFSTDFIPKSKIYGGGGGQLSFKNENPGVSFLNEFTFITGYHAFDMSERKIIEIPGSMDFYVRADGGLRVETDDDANYYSTASGLIDKDKDYTIMLSFGQQAPSGYGVSIIVYDYDNGTISIHNGSKDEGEGPVGNFEEIIYGSLDSNAIYDHITLYEVNYVILAVQSHLSGDPFFWEGGRPSNAAKISGMPGMVYHLINDGDTGHLVDVSGNKNDFIKSTSQNYQFVNTDPRVVYDPPLFTSVWNNALLPNIYKIKNTRFPENDEDDAILVTDVLIQNNKVVVQGADGEFPKNSYIKIDGFDKYSGVFRVLGDTPSGAVIESPDLGNESGNASILPHYINYSTSVKVYAGIPEGEQGDEYKKMELVGEINARPGPDNVSVVDVSDLIMSKIINRNDINSRFLPLDIDTYTAYYIEYAEKYNVYEGLTGVPSLFTSEYTEDFADDCTFPSFENNEFENNLISWAQFCNFPSSCETFEHGSIATYSQLAKVTLPDSPGASFSNNIGQEIEIPPNTPFTIKTSFVTDNSENIFHEASAFVYFEFSDGTTTEAFLHFVRRSTVFGIIPLQTVSKDFVYDKTITAVYFFLVSSHSFDVEVGFSKIEITSVLENPCTNYFYSNLSINEFPSAVGGSMGAYEAQITDGVRLAKFMTTMERPRAYPGRYMDLSIIMSRSLFSGLKNPTGLGVEYNYFNTNRKKTRTATRHLTNKGPGVYRVKLDTDSILKDEKYFDVSIKTPVSERYAFRSDANFNAFLYSPNNYYNFGTSDFSFSVFVKPLSSGSGSIFRVPFDQDSTAINAYYVSTPTGGFIQFGVLSDQDSNIIYTIDPTPIGQTCHLAITRVSGVITLYFNNDNVLSGSRSIDMFDAGDVIISSGSPGSVVWSPQLFSEGLSSQEIAHIFNTNGKLSGLEGLESKCVFNEQFQAGKGRRTTEIRLNNVGTLQQVSQPDHLQRTQNNRYLYLDRVINGLPQEQWPVSDPTAPSVYVDVEDQYFTEKKTFNIERECGTNPVYLTWRNSLGGYEFWLFSAKHEFSHHITEHETFKPDVLHNFPASYAEESNERTSIVRYRDSILLRSRFVDEIQLEGLKTIRESSLVQIFTENGKITVQPDRGSAVWFNEENKLHSFQIRIMLPEQERIKL